MSDEELVGLLKDTVRVKAESQRQVSIRAADGAQFEAGQAGMLEKHMRFYALECFRSVNGSEAHPRWLLQVFCTLTHDTHDTHADKNLPTQRMYYLFANVQFTVKRTLVPLCT